MAETELRRVLGDADVGPLCIGREAELSELRALYDACVAERTARVAIILGPPGIGKTRLTTELHRRFRTAGIPTFEGACREGGATYQPILELAHSALAYLGNVLGDLGSESGRLARIAEVAQVLRGQGAILGGRSPRGRRGALQIVRDGHDQRGLFFEEVRHMLAELGRPRPPAILVSDLHLADSATQALVAYLARTLAPAPGLALDEDFCGLIVATSHADEPPDWAAEAAAHVIRLRGLDPDGVRAFLAAPAVVERFLRASDGVPRRLQSLVENPVDAALPDRIAALSPAAARLVRALAVYGRPAGAAFIERLAARLAAEDETLGAELHAQELAASPLLIRSVVGGELRLGFASSAERQGAVRSVHPDESVRLHRAVGEALLTTPGVDDPAACAEHLLTGHAGETAVDLALTAGEALERSFAYERAAALYARALAATARPDVAAQLEERLADLYELLGDYARALEIVARLGARQPDDAAVQARLGHLHLLRDEFAAAKVALAGARELAVAAGALAIETAVMADLAEACFLEGSHDDAIAAARAALERAAGAVQPEAARPRIAARNTLGKVFLERGEYGHAAHLFGENLDEARLAGLPFEVSRALVNLGVAAIRQGEYAAAEAHYREGLAAAREHGDLRHRAFCLQNLGVMAQWRRDYTAALRYAQEAVQAFKRLGNRPRLGWVAVDLGDLYCDLGDVRRAEAMADLAGRLLGDVAAPHAFLETLRGRIALEKGDRARARAILDEALVAASRVGNADAVNYTLLGLARVELADEDGAAAVTRLAGVMQPCSPWVLAQVLVLRGEARLLEGSLEAAQADLLAAERASAELGDDEGRLRAAAVRAQAAERLGDARAAREAMRLARDLDVKLRARVPADFAEMYGREPWRQALAAEPRRAQTAPPARPTGTRFPRIVGRGAEIAHVLEMIERVAPHDSLVLIRGESGTGKELVAEAIHDLSPRRGRPFVKVNCGALVETLLLSELFGHERGAFTGAMSRRKGRFELADGGTLFLDEIGDISPQTQVALLRVLQTHEFERVGGTQPIRVDVRILCATNRDLEAMVAGGRFREDLYYRLKGIEIDLPPLRQRGGDIPDLARCFLARVAEERGAVPKQLTPSAVEALCRYPWPGNVRELENVIRSVTLFTDGDEIDVKHLHEYLGAAAARPVAGATRDSGREPPAAMREPEPAAGYYEAISGGISLRELKRKIELECITRALAETGGNITRAAERLGMKRPRLSQLLKEHGITPSGKGAEENS